MDPKTPKKTTTRKPRAKKSATDIETPKAVEVDGLHSSPRDTQSAAQESPADLNLAAHRDSRGASNADSYGDSNADSDSDSNADGHADDGLHEEIRRHAYEIYLSRNGEQGDEIADWLEAERRVRVRRTDSSSDLSA